MAKIEGLVKHLAQLQKRAAAAKKDNEASVAVGFSAAYALFVHENLEAAHGAVYNEKYAEDIAAGRKHSRGEAQQAKFLEQPLRENRSKYAKIIATALKQGKTMAQALLLGGLALQRDSQRITPVDKGFLRASAFTRLEI